MPRFRFEYETLLRVRRRAERDVQLEFAAIERERLAMEEAIRSRHRAARACREDLRVALAPGRRTAMGPVRLQAGASLRLQSQTHRLAIELAGAMRRQDEVRGRLLEATRARKAVELLREKRLAEWKREQDRREAAEQDDLVTARASGRSGDL